jgi:hypothetical protein
MYLFHCFLETPNDVLWKPKVTPNPVRETLQQSVDFPERHLLEALPVRKVTMSVAVTDYCTEIFAKSGKEFVSDCYCWSYVKQLGTFKVNLLCIIISIFVGYHSQTIS